MSIRRVTSRCSLIVGSVLVQSKLQYLRVLIVDDHAPSVAVLALALTSRGYTCEAVSDAAEAVECVARFEPDVVFYEWRVEGGSGLGLADRLRAASRAAITVIALSTHDEPDDFCANEGVDAYLTKPFDMMELDCVLAKYTDRA
jgi:two-component system, OmpR family, response regulator